MVTIESKLLEEGTILMSCILTSVSSKSYADLMQIKLEFVEFRSSLTT